MDPEIRFIITETGNTSICVATGYVPSSLSPNLNMLPPYPLLILFSAVSGLVLGIPPNACIVIGYLETIRKKEKLSPSDVIFLAKAIVNVLLQGLMTVQGFLFALYPAILYIKEVYGFLNTPIYFLTYCIFWLTTWLSAHYWTSITNLSSGVFICIKRVVSQFLGRILALTGLLLFCVSAPVMWVLSAVQSNETSTSDVSTIYFRYKISNFYFTLATFLGSILPFCLSLLCLLLTISFLVRHVWRVKNNDSGSTRPNLQAHVTALRTIFFLLLMFSFFWMSQMLLFGKKSSIGKTAGTVSWILRFVSPSVEAVIIFQASTKLRRSILRRFWIRRWRNSET